MDDNNAEQLNITADNKPIIQKYEEAFNIANRNRYQVEQILMNLIKIF